MEEKKFEEHTVQTSSGSDVPPAYGHSSPTKASFGQRIIDSFKRDPNHTVSGHGNAGADGSGFDIETAAHNTAHSPLQRRLKGRHLQMIAIGGSIGMHSQLYTHALAFADFSQVLVSSLVRELFWRLVVQPLF